MAAIARTQILGMCALWPWHKRSDLGSKVIAHPLVMDNNCVKYYSDPTLQWRFMAWTRIFCICALWPWRHDLESRWHDTPLGHGQQLCENNIQIRQVGTKLWPGTMWTDRQTDRQTDRVFPIYPPPPSTLFAGGIITEVLPKFPFPENKIGQITWCTSFDHDLLINLWSL